MDVHQQIARNRRLAADFFEGLSREQLQTQSLCEAWTVQQVLGHLVMPLETGSGAFVREVVRARGSLDAASARIAIELGRRPVAELAQILRDRAETRVRAPGVGPRGQLADTCLHLRDCARPLGLEAGPAIEHWRELLPWMSGGVPGLVPRRRLSGLSLRATDLTWSSGSGAEIAGPAEALALALAGRTAVLPDLIGEGVPLLAARLGSPRR